MEQLTCTAKPSQKPKLLDQVRYALRVLHYSYKTEKAYIPWIYQFVVFHNKRHPAEMGEKEIREFLTHLAVKQKVAASTQNQALCAIIFLYREVLKIDIGDFSDGLVWAKKPGRLPEVYTPEEAQAILNNLTDVYWIMANLLYGAGLRLIECLRLRVKDDLQNRKVKTVELIIDESSLSTNTSKIPMNRMMSLDVKHDEALLGRAIKSVGGRWNQKESVWKLPYKQVLALGLEERIVNKTEKASNDGNLHKRESLERNA